MNFKTWLEAGEKEYSSQGRLVSPQEYERARAGGLAFVDSLRRNKPQPLKHLEENFDRVARTLYERTVLVEWGGATYNPHTGEFVNTGFASALGVNNVKLPIERAEDFGVFSETLRSFVGRNKTSLMMDNHYLGLFRDEKTGTVDFDVSIIVDKEQDAESIQLALGLKGGAYDFATGNGVFAPRAWT